MLKPDQMDTLPLEGLSLSAVAALERETAVVGKDGEIAGVIFSPAAYRELRDAFYDFAACVPEGENFLGSGAIEQPVRPVDWPFPADGPPPSMKQLLAHLAERDTKTERDRTADARREAA